MCLKQCSATTYCHELCFNIFSDSMSRCPCIDSQVQIKELKNRKFAEFHGAHHNSIHKFDANCNINENNTCYNDSECSLRNKHIWTDRRSGKKRFTTRSSLKRILYRLWKWLFHDIKSGSLIHKNSNYRLELSRGKIVKGW